MPKPRRVTLCFAVIIALLMMTVYLCANQSDYDKRTLHPQAFQDGQSGPLFLEKGNYTFTFSYTYVPDAEVQLVRAKTADGDNRLPQVLASAPLEADGQTVIPLTLGEAVYDLQVRYTKITELGYLTIESVGPVWRDTALSLTLIAGVALMLLALYLRETRGGKQPSLTDAGISEAAVHLLLTAVALYATLPVLRGYLTQGLDLPFHLVRIEGIKDGLLDGQFPVRLAPTYNEGVGYASSTMYPELLLYIPALFRLCGVSLLAAYQGFVFLINLATLLVTYHAMKRLTGRAALGIVISVVYSLGVYRLSGVYGRLFLGETLAMIFFPCVMLGMAEVLHRGKLSVWLIAGMTGLIQTHLISVQIAAVFCALYTLGAVALRKTNGRALLRLLAAAGITGLINLWFLLPLLRLMQEDFNIFSYTKRTLSYAVYPQQLFASFVQPFGSAQALGDTAGEMPVSVGLLPGLGILLFVLTQRPKDADALRPLSRVSLGMGLIALWISSTLFPWTYVVKIPVLGDFFYAIQFPFRYLSAASLFLAVVFAVGAAGLAKGNGRLLVAVCLALAVFNAAPMLDQFVQSEQQTVVMDSKQDGAYIWLTGLRDYYASDTDFYALNDQPMALDAPDGVAIRNFSKTGLHITFDYVSAEEQTVTLPVYHYPGYRAMLNGETLAARDGENHLLALALPAGEGTVTVWYAGFWYDNAANLVSLAAVLSLAAGMIRKRRRA